MKLHATLAQRLFSSTYELEHRIRSVSREPQSIKQVCRGSCLEVNMLCTVVRLCQRNAKAHPVLPHHYSAHRVPYVISNNMFYHLRQCSAGWMWNNVDMYLVNGAHSHYPKVSCIMFLVTEQRSACACICVVRIYMSEN